MYALVLDSTYSYLLQRRLVDGEKGCARQSDRSVDVVAVVWLVVRDGRTDRPG